VESGVRFSLVGDPQTNCRVSGRGLLLEAKCLCFDDSGIEPSITVSALSACRHLDQFKGHREMSKSGPCVIFMTFHDTFAALNEVLLSGWLTHAAEKYAAKLSGG
jgi:hypothetical protein